MPLSTFNLARVIEAYNNERKQNYAPHEDFDFAFFEKNLLAQANAAILVINTGLERYRWTPQERAFLQKKKQYFKKYTRPISYQDESLVLFTPEDEQASWEYEQKIQFWDWMHTWFTQLDSEQWQVWQKKIAGSNKSRLVELKEFWEKIAPFAVHTHAGLYDCAKELLPSLEQHYRLARQHLFAAFWQIPSDISTAYRKYLDIFLDEAKQLKPLMAAQMLARLKAFDRNRLSEGNVLVYLHTELQRVGAVSKEEQIPYHAEQLTSEQFHYFHFYIEQHGDPETKNQLKSLSWLKPSDSSCSTDYRLTSNSAFLIPTEFMKDVPLKPRRPRWLYRGHNLRHEFFQDQGLLLVALKSLPSINGLDIDLRNIANVYACLNDLHQKQKSIRQAIEAIDGKKQRKLGIFQRQTKIFIQRWQHQLVNWHSKIIESKLELAEKVAAQLQACDPIQAALNAWSTISFMKDMIKLLHAELEAYPHEKLQERLVQIEDNMTEILSHFKVLQLMTKASTGKVLNQAKVEYLDEVTDAIRLNDSIAYVNFQACCRSHFDNMRILLRNELKSNPSYLLDPASHADRIISVNSILKKFSDAESCQESQQCIAEKLPKYFLKYLEAILQCGQRAEYLSRYQPAIANFERVILALDPGIMFANKTLSAHVEDLQKLQQEAFNGQGSWIFVQAHCKGLAQELLSIYLGKRTEKDLLNFDKQLFDFISNDSDLSFSEASVSEIQKLSNRQIENNVAHLADLPLKPEQKTIVGLNGGSCAYIYELLSLRKSVHSQYRTIQSKAMSMSEKTLKIEQLATTLNTSLQENSKQLVGTVMGYSRSGRHRLFTKRYFDTAYLKLEDADQIADSLSYSNK